MKNSDKKYISFSRRLLNVKNKNKTTEATTKSSNIDDSKLLQLIEQVNMLEQEILKLQIQSILK